MVRSVPWWILRYHPNVAKLWLTSTFVSSTFSSLKLKENKKWLFATNATAQPDAWIILTGWHFTFNIAKFQLNRMKVNGCLWGGFYHSKVGWVWGGVGAMITGGGRGQVELIQTEVMSESFTTQLFLSLEIILTPRSTQVCWTYSLKLLDGYSKKFRWISVRGGRIPLNSIWRLPYPWQG